MRGKRTALRRNEGQLKTLFLFGRVFPAGMRGNGQMEKKYHLIRGDAIVLLGCFSSPIAVWIKIARVDHPGRAAISRGELETPFVFPAVSRSGC